MIASEIAAELTRRAHALGVGVLLSPKEFVYTNGVPVSGFFDYSQDIPIIVVATAKEEERWVTILAHEYCHATQWSENTQIWRDASKGDRVWEWLEGKPLRNPRELTPYIRDMEADCERRTVRTLKELNAPFDLERYQRAANAYIHFYNVMAIERKWFAKGKAPYNTPEVLYEANPTLDLDFNKTPKRLWNAILTCL